MARVTLVCTITAYTITGITSPASIALVIPTRLAVLKLIVAALGAKLAFNFTSFQATVAECLCDTSIRHPVSTVAVLTASFTHAHVGLGEAVIASVEFLFLVRGFGGIVSTAGTPSRA